jgi:hypothetical protein
MLCILSWRIFWLTMLNRSVRSATPTIALTNLEIDLLNQLVPARTGPKSRAPPTLQASLDQLARLGGYLARANDSPPGNTVFWRGLSRLTDIAIGYELGVNNVGN